MARLSYLEIARLEEAHQSSGTAEVSDEAEPIGGGWMCFSGQGSWASQALGLGLGGPVSDAELDRLVEFYVSRGCEPRIEVCPFADGSLVRGLGERGFRLKEFECVLARELPPDEDLRAGLPHGWPEDLELEHLDPTDGDRVRAFAVVSTSGFRRGAGDGGDGGDENMLEMACRTVRQPGCDSYLALVDGLPVGGGTVGCRQGCASLFGTSVLPSHRRRGIQAALIVRRLERARELGCRLASIGSLPGISTERNAVRMGFFMAYNKAIMVRPGAGLVSSP